MASAHGFIEHIGSGRSISGEVFVPDVDKSYDPGEDFYMYVNSRWQRSVKMPSYEDDFGISEEIELDLRNILGDALDKYMRLKPAAGLSQLAKSFLDPAAQGSAVRDLTHELNALDCVNSPESLAQAIGHLNNIQCRAPLSFVVNSDYYDSKKCCVYIYEASLGLPSKSNYSIHSSNKILSAYGRFLARLGELFHIDDLETVLTTEATLIPFMSNVGELRDVSYVYNPMTLSQLSTKYPHIDWSTALRTWGLDESKQNDIKFVITNMKYVAHLNKLIKEGDYGTMVKWMKMNIILNFLKFLPPPFDDLHYEFYEKLLRGVDKKLPQATLALRVLMKFTPQDLSRMFVELEVPEKIKTESTKYVRLLKAATARRIRLLEWMESSTKTAALRKVAAMTFQVAFPSHWESETDTVRIDSHRPLMNLITLSSADSKKMINDLLHVTCAKRPSKWRDGAFEVNAYYYPEGNMMVVPAGILRPPFFDTRRSDGWNLGAIGVAISHEITHGFDDDGRVFDAHGNYKDWWTLSDERKYKSMSRAVVELFDGKKYMGGKVDGKMTLNENLADLGGMAIALEALNAILPKDNALRKAAYRDFFIAFAVSWRQKDRPKKARQALLLDVHAPPYYRVNLTVCQFEEFYFAFDIKPGSKNYVSPEERISFW
jgi:putative endopeptidase